MATTLIERPTYRMRIKRAIPWLGMGLCLAALGGHLALDLAGRKSAAGAAPTSVHTDQPAGTQQTPLANRATTVLLSEAKFQAAKLSTARARYDEFSTELGVPGRIEVNADRRIQIRPRAAGVVREVHAFLGQNVKRGDLLVTLDSPDVGTARLNLRARQRELNTARIEADWKSEVASAVALLIPEIRKGTDPAAIEKEFADKPLGSYRGSLLQAYAQFDIAAHEEEKTAGLRRQEVIGEHPAVLALHTRQGLQAMLYATIEQVKFDAAQGKRLADQQVRRAESDVIDAAQRLRILGVSEDIRDLLDHADKADTLAVDEDVTIYRISSPFDGTIIQKDAVLSQKADLNDVLFTVADLNSVWVTANIAESDVASVPKIRGGAIRLSATAYGTRMFPAHLLSVGAMVDPQTRTVPLLAQTDNHDGLLKPGLFVRILLDSPTTERVLTVPHAGVVEIEGKSGVFVPAKPGGTAATDQHAFTFLPIETGRDAGDRVVVKSGLKEGDVVVASGAYQLKSELILQNQTEED
jgi:membrane fusion protein, heavy metal efflux system